MSDPPHEPAPLEEILRLYNEEGLNVPAIAETLGVSRQTVYQRLRRKSIKLQARNRIYDEAERRRVFKTEGVSSPSMSQV